MSNHIAYIGLSIIFVAVISYMIYYNLRMRSKSPNQKHGALSDTPSQIVSELRADGTRIDSPK
jgi:hypothetical protein